jgi:hypothetical protein
VLGEVGLQNPETGTSTKTPFRSFGYWDLEESRVKTLHHRSPEVPKCETPKILKQAHQPEFQIPGVGGVKETLHHRNVETPKCEMPNPEVSMSKTPFQSFRYWDLEESRVETLHHRSPEVPKCETPKILKQAHQPEFRIPGVGGVKSRDSSSQESRSAEM